MAVKYFDAKMQHRPIKGYIMHVTGTCLKNSLTELVTYLCDGLKEEV